MPADASQNLKAHLDARITAEGAYSDQNPFAEFLARQKETYVQKQMITWRAQQNNNAASTEQMAEQERTLREKFDKEQLPTLIKEFKEKTLAVYNGRDEVDKEKLVAGVAGGAGAGGLFSMFTGGGFGSIGGILSMMHHAVTHAIGGALLSLPVIGDWIGAAKTKFLSKEPMSWDNARAAYQKEKLGKRMSESLGEYADMDKLNALVGEAMDGKSVPNIMQPGNASSVTSASVAPVSVSGVRADRSFDKPNGSNPPSPPPTPGTPTTASPRAVTQAP